MKKYQAGFVPINYKTSGKILLTIGLLLILNNLINIFPLPSHLFYIGLGLIFLSFYLIFITPKE